ncbi:hypothetical protein [Ralstonia sp. UBA689]|nr:hypothetical protein [Ralstonia sp. UBA689]
MNVHTSTQLLTPSHLIATSKVEDGERALPSTMHVAELGYFVKQQR